MSIGAVNRMISRESVALLRPTPGRSESWVDIKRCVDGKWTPSYPHSGMHFALIHFLSFKFQQI